MKMYESPGKRAYHMAEKIFPICRSIMGEGVRKTLHILDDYISQSEGIHFNIYEVPSDTSVFDWIIPKEWVIREAYIDDESGNRIIDMKNNNLHVLGYSSSIDKWVDLAELKEHIFTQPDQPETIPYVTSYYKEQYGFCMSQEQLNTLPDGKYHMYIDSEFIDGNLTYAEINLAGKSDEAVLITSYICHPSMANNECSGPALLAELVRYVNKMKNRHYTYIFVLNPETIGSLTYLQQKYQYLKEHLAVGAVLSCVGDDRSYSLIHTRYADTLADKSLANILSNRKGFHEYSFLERGSDERQYNAPGIDLPVVGFCRTKYGEYSEYHTSADDMGMISPAGFQGSFEVMTEWLNALEHNHKYKIKILGEPQLGKRGLYPNISRRGGYEEVAAIKDFIAYADGSNDLIDLSDIIGVPVKKLIHIAEKLEEEGLLDKCDC